MNSQSSRKTHGIRLLTPAAIRGIQLEFAMIESPAPRARFQNFPFVAHEAPGTAPASKRTEKRALAA